MSGWAVGAAEPSDVAGRGAGMGERRERPMGAAGPGSLVPESRIERGVGMSVRNIGSARAGVECRRAAGCGGVALGSIAV